MTVCNWENGKAVPSVKLWQAVADALWLTIQDLEIGGK